LQEKLTEKLVEKVLDVLGGIGDKRITESGMNPKETKNEAS
jgi:hypothetical protein